MNPRQPFLTLISLYFIKTNSGQQSQLSPEIPKWGRRGLLPVPSSVDAFTARHLWSTATCASDSQEGPCGTKERLGHKRDRDPYQGSHEKTAYWESRYREKGPWPIALVQGPAVPRH